jgi:SAM-dependent methyltransferase
VNFVEKIHAAYWASRRVEVLGEHLDKLIPPQASLLDVGCGDGLLTRHLGARRSDLELRGMDVAIRPGASIPIELFDGKTIPAPDASFDCTLLVDALHHCRHPEDLLAEASRVSRKHLLIKDHLLSGWLAGPTLRFMDRIGNARHGVDLPHHYWKETTWRRVWKELNLEVAAFQVDLKLYPPPFGLLFDRGLHFIALLRRG